MIKPAHAQRDGLLISTGFEEFEIRWHRSRSRSCGCGGWLGRFRSGHGRIGYEEQMCIRLELGNLIKKRQRQHMFNIMIVTTSKNQEKKAVS